MKKLIYLLLLPLFFANCKDGCTVLADMPYTVEVDIPAGLNPLQSHYFVIENIPNQKSNIFASNSLTDEDISEIKGKSARFTTLFNSAEYDFIREVSIQIYTDNPDDWSEVFYRTNVQENTGSDLDLIGSLTDIQRHLTAPTFNIVVKLDLRRTNTQSVETRFDFQFGAC